MQNGEVTLHNNSLRVISGEKRGKKNATLHLNARLCGMRPVDLHFKFCKYRTKRFSRERKPRERQSHP